MRCDGKLHSTRAEESAEAHQRAVHSSGTAVELAVADDDDGNDDVDDDDDDDDEDDDYDDDDDADDADDDVNDDG